MEIKIACRGAAEVDISELTEFQGDLKTLSKENHDKLRKEILELGFSEPVSVWQKDGKNFILNGHQRVRVLREMRDAEKIPIPKIPIVFVEAESEHQAKKKVLALTSQYGEMTQDGLFNFISAADITLDYVTESFRFPELDTSVLPVGEFELDDLEETESKVFNILEISFPDKESLMQEYDALTSRGLLVKIKS